MKIARHLVCLTLIAVVASSAAAEDKQKKGKGKRRGGKKPTATQRLISKMDLTDEQKTQVAAIDKQFAERFSAARKEMASVLTDDQRKTQRKLSQEAKAAGTRPRELRRQLEAALNLTDDQKAKRVEARKNQQQLNSEIVTALKSVLTAEQQKLLPKKRTGRGQRKKGRKNGRKKDAA